MASDSVKLLSTLGSKFSLRAQFALDLKGVSYHIQKEDLGNKSEELLKANHIYGAVPVLIHNGKVICESLIIVDYIDSAWPDSHKLLPDDPYDKAVARFWANFVDQKVEGAGNRIMRATGEAQKQAGEDFKWSLMKVNEALGTVAAGKPFFGGDAMNFADVALAPFICWFEGYQKVGGFRFPGAEEWPHLYKWIDAVYSVEALQKSLLKPEDLIEFIELYRKQVIGKD